jgi:L-rhamnose mutarotase
MQRRCQIIHIRPEAKQDYIRYHERVWPAVLATISECHIRNYSIYIDGNLLVACFEYHGEDYAADMARMASDPETQRWWSIMDPMQVPLPHAPRNERWLELQEVFHVD